MCVAPRPATRGEGGRRPGEGRLSSRAGARDLVARAPPDRPDSFHEKATACQRCRRRGGGILDCWFGNVRHIGEFDLASIRTLIDAIASGA